MRKTKAAPTDEALPEVHLVDPSRYRALPLERCVLAEWNYKEDDAALQEKLEANLKLNGQVENILVRTLPTGYYEVVNGNHRLRALQALGAPDVMVFDLGPISDAAARRIAIETNETRFAPDNLRLAALIRELQADTTLADLTATLPYTDKELDAFNTMLDWAWPDTTPADLEDSDRGGGTYTCPACGHQFSLK